MVYNDLHRYYTTCIVLLEYEQTINTRRWCHEANRKGHVAHPLRAPPPETVVTGIATTIMASGETNVLAMESLFVRRT